jgi:uncharacterized membrane protein YphA (DoxX/SURF4 family)
MARLSDLLDDRIDRHHRRRARATALLPLPPRVGPSRPHGITVNARLARIDARRVAQISGLVFIPAGLVKFGFHHWELHAFRDFGIPAAAVMEPIVGVLEILGGVLLLRRTLILPTAVVLAVIMLVAFVAGGIIHASPIPSDTLAPALLVAMIYLIHAERHEPIP